MAEKRWLSINIKHIESSAGQLIETFSGKESPFSTIKLQFTIGGRKQEPLPGLYRGLLVGFLFLCCACLFL